MGQPVEANDNQERKIELLQARIAELEEKLQEKEATPFTGEMAQFAQFAMDRASDCIYWMGPDAKFIYVNDAACRSLGYTREELLSLTVHDIAPAYPSYLWPEMWGKIKKDKTYSFEANHRTKKGCVFPIEIRANYLEVEGREFNCSIVRDISERKRMEQEFKKLEGQAQEIFNSSPGLIFLKDLNGRYLHINHQFEKRFHLRKQDVLGKTDREIFPLQQAASFWANDQQVIQTQGPLEFEETTHYGGKPHTAIVHKFPLKEPDGKLYGIGGITTDITQRKRTEEELQKSEERARGQLAELELLYNSSPVGFCLIDTDLRFLRVNELMASINGCPAKDHIGRTLAEIIPILAPKVEPIYRKVIDTRLPILDVEIHGITQAVPQDERDWLVSYFPIVEDETVLGITTVVQDITERKKGEDSLHASHMRLKEAQGLAHIGNWELDLVNNILTWSDEIFKIFEIDQKHFGASFEAFLDSIHPEDREFVNQKYTESVKQKVPYEVDHRLLMADGRIKFVQERCRTFYNDMGNPLRSLGTVQDLTDRKKSEEIQTSLGRLLEESLNEIYIFDAKTFRFLLVNKGARENLGYSIEELQQLTPVDLKPEFNTESFANLLSSLHKKEKKSLQFETVHRRKDGTGYPVEVHLQIANWESKPAFVAMILDSTKRKQAEKALQASEKRYRLLFEQAPLSIHEIDLFGRLINMNPMGHRMMGVQNPCDIEGMLYLDAVAPQDKDRIKRLMNAAFQGEMAHFEFTTAGRNKPKTLASSFIPIKGSNAEVTSLMGITQDVTERKAAETSLKISEKSIRKLYEITSSQDLSFDQKIRALLELGCQRLGLPYGTLTKRAGEHLELEFIHAPDHSWMEHSFVPICESFCGLTLDREVPLVFEHAGESNWKTHPAYEALGLEAYIGTQVRVGQSVYGTLCFLDRVPFSGTFTEADQDFLQLMARWVGSELERKQGEHAIYESEERFRMVCEAIPQQVWTARPDGSLDYVNRRIIDYFQLPFELLIEQGWNTQVHPDDLPNCLEQWAHSIQTHQPYEIEFRLHSGEDQDYRPHICRALPLLNSEEQVIKWLGTNTDITEFKAIEAQLRQTHKMEAIGTLAGGIAHDFNNVLGVILGYSELVLQKAKGNESLEKNLQEIVIAGKRARDLVQHILVFSRQEELSKKPINLNFLIPDVLKMVRSTLPSTIEIHQKFTKDVASILGDPTQLHQIVLNLCSNAEYAMREEGGTLEIGIENLTFEKPQIFNHSTLTTGDYVRLWVRDTGQGIPPNVMGRIFDPFFTTKGVGKGTGMGLSVVHGIVTAHHGAISVHSPLGQGTTFDIYLPSVEGKIPEPLTQVEAPHVALKKKARVLFIDDEMSLACFGKEALEALGCEVDIYTNGFEALDRFRKDPTLYDVVISDQTMPGITGEKLAKELLLLRNNLPIILCTGFSHALTTEKAEQIGIKGFLKKPVLIEDLIQTLNKAL